MKNKDEITTQPIDIVQVDTELKELLVDYVGSTFDDDRDTVLVDDIVEVVAREFPEFLLAVAEESWISGYEQALQDRQGVAHVSQLVNEKGDKE